MNNIKKYPVVFILIIIAGVFLCACSNDDNDEILIPRNAVYDYVTLDKSTSTGSVFTFQKDGDSEIITYTCKNNFTKVNKIKQGMRLIICYNRTDGETYTSGPIKLYGFSLLANTEQKVILDNDDILSYGKENRTLITTLWRTGNYINVTQQIYVSKVRVPDKYALVVDNSTIDSRYPELWLSYINAENNDGENLMTIHGSFDISEIWDREDIDGIIIACNTPNGIYKKTFNK